MRLYINGHLIDVYTKSVIAQTKQVNDINDLDYRQSNYTNAFNVPKTANNVRILNFMTIPGNTSRVPYQQNSCSLFGDSGECFVLDGRAIVKDEGDDYSIYIYDGLINLYKKIENQTLFDLGLSEITHTKDTPTIVASWASFDTYYKYILADYNGITGNTGAGSVNSDWLVPSVSVPYLWAKIFAANGFTYSGNVFLTQAFKNLWMTYPKGVNSIASEDAVFHAEQWEYRGIGSGYSYLKLLNPDIHIEDFGGQLTGQNVYIRPGVSGQYRLKVKGSVFTDVPTPGEDGRLFVVTNGDNILPAAADNANTQTVVTTTDGETVQFDFEHLYDLSNTSSLSLAFKLPKNSVGYLSPTDLNVEVTLYKINATSIDFGLAFKDFPVKDFMKEILYRFGLTVYTEKSNPYHYQFLTLQEILQNIDYNDWTDKFSHKVKENYIYGSYAQRNYFRYKYNDEQATHNDGYISIDNVNLPDAKDAIKSKIYSPEREKVTYMNRPTNVYKLWSKEPNTGDDAATNPYKFNALDKRYYFLRAEPQTGSFDVRSDETGQLTSHSGIYYIENYYRLPFDEIRKDYYLPLSQILEDAVLIEAKMLLNESDVANIDFRKLIYIQQEANYFLLNRIVDYIPGRLTTVELVRVKYAPVAPPPTLVITELRYSPGIIRVYFEISFQTPTLVVQYSNDYGVTWTSNGGGAISPRSFNISAPGVYKVRLYVPTMELYSVNIATINVS